MNNKDNQPTAAILHANATQTGKSLSKSENQSIGHILPNDVNPNSISGKVIRTLSAYPYPMVPKFTGMGDVNGKKF